MTWPELAQQVVAKRAIGERFSIMVAPEGANDWTLEVVSVQDGQTVAVGRGFSIDEAANDALGRWPADGGA